MIRSIKKNLSFLQNKVAKYDNVFVVGLIVYFSFITIGMIAFAF